MSRSVESAVQRIAGLPQEHLRSPIRESVEQTPHAHTSGRHAPIMH